MKILYLAPRAISIFLKKKLQKKWIKIQSESMKHRKTQWEENRNFFFLQKMKINQKNAIILIIVFWSYQLISLHITNTRTHTPYSKSQNNWWNFHLWNLWIFRYVHCVSYRFHFNAYFTYRLSSSSSRSAFIKCWTWAHHLLPSLTANKISVMLSI